MEETLGASELVEAWRDAVRAAELVERLAAVAMRASEQADPGTLASGEIAELAEAAAEAAGSAAHKAHDIAAKARHLATGSRENAERTPIEGPIQRHAF
jgi:hypothetical protein